MQAVGALVALVQRLVEDAPQAEAEDGEDDGAEGEAEAGVHGDDRPVEVVAVRAHPLTALRVALQTDALVVHEVADRVEGRLVVEDRRLVQVRVAVGVRVAEDLTRRGEIGLGLGVSVCLFFTLAQVLLVTRRKPTLQMHTSLENQHTDPAICFCK